MRKLLSLSALVAIFAISCQQELNNDVVVDNNTTTITDLNPYRSYDEALQIAEESIAIIEGKGTTRANAQRRIAKDKGQVIRTETTRSGGGGEPVAYVFNFEEEQGFAVIAADERFDPVIAVTEQGSYTYGEPTGVEAFDEYMDNTIDLMSVIFPPTIDPGDPITPTPGTYFEEVDIYNRVDPLLATKWSQEGIYGAYCETGVCGCVTTAFGQIMAYHQHPSSILYSFMGYTTLSNLDWPSIVMHTSDGVTDDSCDCGCNYHQIGRLLREVGERFDTEYGTDANGNGYGSSNLLKAATGLPSLGYNTPQFANNIDITDYISNIYANLDNNYPIMIGGVYTHEEGSSGHAWVIDGYHEEASGRNYYVSNPEYNWLNPTPGVPQYIFSHSTVVRTEMLHYNWGHNGLCDGWYNVGVFKMNDEVEYDEYHFYAYQMNQNYNENMQILYNIIPN
ncbi:MAG: C10 family peptidase [Alistipes sp.]|nr:C10 family peptidase [Alistipes sp.]